MPPIDLVSLFVRNRGCVVTFDVTTLGLRLRSRPGNDREAHR